VTRRPALAVEEARDQAARVEAAIRRDTTIAAAVLDRLPELLAYTRNARGLTYRAAAAQIGCSRTTLHRAERGEGIVLAVAIPILRWLAGQPQLSRERS
jgi:DNA-binding XRE family transcriptional regulator